MLAAPAQADARVQVARLVHGDSNPGGPGYREESVDWGPSPEVELEPRHVDYGSYVEIPDSESLRPDGSFTLALWFLPTLVGGGWHTLAAKWVSDDLGFALYIMGDHVLTAAISHDGRTAVWCTAREFLQRGWQFVAFTYAMDEGVLRLHQWARGTSDPRVRGRPDPLITAEKRVPRGRVHPSSAPLLLGATRDRPGHHWAHFNGKLARPTLLEGALADEDVWRLAQGEEPAALAHVLGCWDLSLEVSGRLVKDISPYGNDGIAVNAPSRAVTGPWWSGYDSRLYTDAPEDYDAIHLHEDDLEDAGWEPTFAVEIPMDARSAIYALRVETEADRLFLPFIVRPNQPQADLAVIAHTLTWLAYSSNRQPYSATEDGVLDRALCSYDIHTDGSLAYYTTRRKPTRSWNPTSGFPNWGGHTITTSLYLIDWLDHKGFAYDLFAEEDLHRQGAALLTPYRTLVLGSHPEYWTKAMIDALEAYLYAGGRVLYLGGNGLWWVTSIDPERPWLIEVRKDGGTKAGSDQPETWTLRPPGEQQHSTTLEVGGEWTHRGRPPRALLGVECAGSVFWPSQPPWGFRRLPLSYDARYAWIFDGVAEEVIGDFGLNLGSAAAFEVDRVYDWRWWPVEPPALLARAAHPLMFPIRNEPTPPRADLALTLFPHGGAVFAAGAVSWTGSLSHEGYANNVSLVTENVLLRFLTTPAGQPVVHAQHDASSDGAAAAKVRPESPA